MAYTIYHSNDISEFIKRHSSLFHTSDLFGEKTVTVVQNRNIASWLRLELTKIDGISMDLEVEYPENAIKKLVLGYKTGRSMFNYLEEDSQKSLLFMDSLKIVLYKSLEELLVDGIAYPKLYDYVQKSSQRLFQLSDSIAGLFYHYAMNCPQMVDSWDNNKLYVNSSGNLLREEDQKWQMSLWNHIFNRNTPYLHISKVLTKVLDSNDPYEPTESPFGKCRIILFGSSFLGESAIKFFNFLSKDIDVHHFILTPSKIYAGEEEVKPLSILNNFSGLINGFTAISRENDFQKTRESFFTEIKGNTLLSSIQRGIRDNSFTDDKNPELQSFSFTDNSLKICRVTGGWREIEVLKDKILALLDGDPTLKLTDIGIVAPDMTIYAPFIEGVFSEVQLQEDGTPHFGETHIPYNIMGLKGGDDSPYIRGIISILDLAGSNFNRKDIFDVISNPCFMSKFNITQTTRDFFLEIASELNIKWGIDGEHKKDIGYNNDNFDTWEAGFKRFLLGMALNREDNPTIPYSINDSSGSELIGEFVHIIRSLYSDVWGLTTLSLKMDEWVFLIETIMETYLKPVKNDTFDERERISIKQQFRNILNLLDDLNNLSNFKNDRVPFPVFKSLLKEFIVKSGNSRGRYLTQGVTFSSLKPLRAVPFKHIFVLGLNEDEFPGRESVPSYDLRSIYDQKIDLSKRQNDKFAFLELILSAKNSLTLFYRGKNQVTGESLQPSVVINELLEVIANNFDNSDLQRSHLMEDHPLQNFDSKYFDQVSDLKSFNKRSFESAKAYIESKSINTSLDLNVTFPDEEVIEIKISDIIQFIKNPVRQFFTKGQNLYIDKSISEEEDVYENREIEVLKKWKLADLTLQMGLEEKLDTDEFIDSFFKVAKLEGLYKDSPLTNNVREDIEEIVTGVGNFLTEHNISGTNFKKSDRELNGDFEPIKLTVDGQKILITGDMDRIWTNGEKECFIPSVTLGKAKEMKVSSRITPYIYSLLIFNHKDMREEKLTAYSIGKERVEPVVFEYKADSQDKLEKILSLYLKNRTQPIPLVPDIMKSPDIETVSSEWEKAMNNTTTYSMLRECPYINMVYTDTPEFDEDDIKNMFDGIYSELVPVKAKKK